MKILGFFDTSHSFPSGGTSTTIKLQEELAKLGVELDLILFDHFRSYPILFSPIETVALPSYSKMAEEIEKRTFDAIHIFSEGPLTRQAVRYCERNQIPFTSSYVTHLDIALEKWFHIPKKLTQKWVRRHHKNSQRILIPTPSLEGILREKKFIQEIVHVGIGMEHEKFSFRADSQELKDLEKPIFITHGRISKEKNYESFLDLDLPGSKVVIGDGPHKASLEKKYRGRAIFLPYQENIASILSAADVFVFPSLFDTFGIVFLEAMACGLPIAAFPDVGGPQDVVQNGFNGFLSFDLQQAAINCLEIPRKNCVETVKPFQWKSVAENFLHNQVWISETDNQLLSA